MQLQPEHALLMLNSFLLPQIKNEQKTTLKVIQAVPVDKGEYRPDPRSMSALDLVWHIAATEMFFMDAVVNGKFQSGGERPESIANSADVAAWYSDKFSEHFDQVCNLTGEQLLQKTPFHDIFNETGLAYLNIMICHSIHHRGQLSAYLRPMGAKVPSIYGPSGDEGLAEAAGQ